MEIKKWFLSHENNDPFWDGIGLFCFFVVVTITAVLYYALKGV